MKQSPNPWISLLTHMAPHIVITILSTIVPINPHDCFVTGNLYFWRPSPFHPAQFLSTLTPAVLWPTGISNPRILLISPCYLFPLLSSFAYLSISTFVVKHYSHSLAPLFSCPLITSIHPSEKTTAYTKFNSLNTLHPCPLPSELGCRKTQNNTG